MPTDRYNLHEEEDEDEAKQGICHPTVVGERHNSLSEYSLSFPQVFYAYGCFFTMFQVNKRSLIKQLFKHTFKNLFC